jgi:hypothetical protein
MDQEAIDRRKRKILAGLKNDDYMSYNSYEKNGKRRYP